MAAAILSFHVVVAIIERLPAGNSVLRVYVVGPPWQAILSAEIGVTGTRRLVSLGMLGVLCPF